MCIALDRRDEKMNQMLFSTLSQCMFSLVALCFSLTVSTCVFYGPTQCGLATCSPCLPCGLATCSPCLLSFPLLCVHHKFCTSAEVGWSISHSFIFSLNWFCRICQDQIVMIQCICLTHSRSHTKKNVACFITQFLFKWTTSVDAPTVDAMVCKPLVVFERKNCFVCAFKFKRKNCTESYSPLVRRTCSV